MDDYIKRKDAINGIRQNHCSLCPHENKNHEDIHCQYCDYDEAVNDLEDVPASDVVEVVRCKDCKFWKDKHVLLRDRRERQYTKEEYDFSEFLISPCVSADIGINVGSKCMYDDQHGYICDKTVFREADDYCSKGEKRTCSYEQWWGIVDGYYPKEET